MADIRSRTLETENRRLKQMVAELMLDNHLLRIDAARRFLDKIRLNIEEDAAAERPSSRARADHGLRTPEPMRRASRHEKPS